MDYRLLGLRGPRVSVLGLGFWQAGSRLWDWDINLLSELRRGVQYAVTYGVNFFDTAEIYGWGESERILGKILREVRADDVIIASKLAGYRWTYYSLRKGVENINRRIGRTIDLIQHHWPPPIYVSVCRLARMLEKLVRDGYAMYYGLSNYPKKLVERVLECSKRIEPVSNQIQYSLAYRSPESRLIPYLMESGLGVIAWSPLAKGALAGLDKPVTSAQRRDPIFNRVIQDKELQHIVDRIARRIKASRSQIALAWIIEKGIIPIPGFRRFERVKDYVTAANIRLSLSDIELLDEASRKYLADEDYKPLQSMRFIPGFIQWLGIHGMRGI